MNQHTPAEEPLLGEVRFRVPLPLVIPGLALLLIAAFAVGFAKVLLDVPAEAATVIALATAANILGACAFVALRPRVGSSTMLELLAIVAYPVLIGVVIAQSGIGAEAHGAPHGAPPPAPVEGTVVSAANIAFDTSELTLAAGEEATIQFDNADSQPHNISIYKDQAAGAAQSNPLFLGDVIQGGESITYTFDAPKKGQYYFQCDVHPNMNGDVIVE